MPEVLQRREIAHLEAWAARRTRKPIVIGGARQVGKSTLVREFARASGLTLVAVDFDATRSCGRPSPDATQCASWLCSSC